MVVVVPTRCTIGIGEGDFFDKFNGCCVSAISTCSSIRLGEAIRPMLEPDDEEEDGDGPGGETLDDVECGDWK